MDHQPIDKLLENRIKAARRDRVLRMLLLIAAVLIVIGCVSAAIVSSAKRSAGEQTEPNPAQTRTEETVISPSAEVSPPPQEEPTESPSAETIPQQAEESAEPVSIETFAPQEEPSTGESTEQPVETEEPQSVTHEMQVVWFGDSDAPDSLTVHVTHDGDELLTVTLTEADGWYYSWTDEYRGQELRLEGDYPDSISIEYIVTGDHFTLTATNITGDLPQTGANPIGGMLTMLAGAAMMVISLAARNKESE